MCDPMNPTCIPKEVSPSRLSTSGYIRYKWRSRTMVTFFFFTGVARIIDGSDNRRSMYLKLLSDNKLLGMTLLQGVSNSSAA